MPYWRELFSTGYINPDDGLPDVSGAQSSEIVSILSAGTFFGALAASPMGDIVGRRLGLILSTGVFTFGVILQTIATAIPLFVAGRFFAGFGVGLISALSKSRQSRYICGVRAYVRTSFADRVTFCQSLSTSQRPHQSGFEEPLSEATSLPSPSVFSSPPLSTTLRRTDKIPDLTVSPSPFSLPGPSSWSVVCSFYPRLPVT